MDLVHHFPMLLIPYHVGVSYVRHFHILYSVVHRYYPKLPVKMVYQ
ncbi:unnamed protein product [Onchocerca flexuosa]|uniref:Uncharacterized protein n=1 Tax=Onchocerca flexuosa TaxID=387005 RepID=A0A183HME5_9BILA|nr:unnamed protein product [Onchocerca flexuosa]